MENLFYDVGYYAGKTALLIGKLAWYGASGAIHAVYDSSFNATNGINATDVVSSAETMVATNVLNAAKSTSIYEITPLACVSSLIYCGAALSLAFCINHGVVTFLNRHKSNAQFLPSNQNECLDLNSVMDTVADSENEQCCVCIHNKRNICFESCGHVAACGSCAKLLTEKICPLCRKKSQKFVHVIL